jgi:hypothetical protein
MRPQASNIVGEDLEVIYEYLQSLKK